MKQVKLIPLSQATVEALESGVEAFESRYQVRLDQAAEFAMEPAWQTVALLARSPRPAPWGCYLAADPQSDAVVGTCGFKAGPDAGRGIEIAYYTFPPFELQGHATAMARELTALAQSSPEVNLILAHTLPEENASGSVLKKCGFRLVGEVIDPEDGRIWRWELPVA